MKITSTQSRFYGNVFYVAFSFITDSYEQLLLFGDCSCSYSNGVFSCGTQNFVCVSIEFQRSMKTNHTMWCKNEQFLICRDQGSMPNDISLLQSVHVFRFESIFFVHTRTQRRASSSKTWIIFFWLNGGIVFDLLSAFMACGLQARRLYVCSKVEMDLKRNASFII